MIAFKFYAMDNGTKRMLGGCGENKKDHLTQKYISKAKLSKFDSVHLVTYNVILTPLSYEEVSDDVVWDNIDLINQRSE